MTKKTRKKSISYASLKRKLDQVFSEWTRRRFADSTGMVRCVTCRVKRHWQDRIDAGHFVSRSYLSTRWNPENVAPQCKMCNGYKKGATAAFAAWGVDRYGMDWPARMVSMSRESVKLTSSDLQAMIEDYKGKLEGLYGDLRFTGRQ